MERQVQRVEPLAPGAGGRGPGLQPRRQQGFEPTADRLAEHRCRAVGRNAEDQRRAVDDRAELKIAEGRPVDRIHRRAGSLGSGAECARFAVVLGVDQGDRRADEIVWHPGAFDEAQARALGDQRAHLGAWRRGEDVEVRAGGVQELGLPHGTRGRARQHGALAVEREEHRQHGQRLQRRGGAGGRRFDARLVHPSFKLVQLADVGVVILRAKSSGLAKSLIVKHVRRHAGTAARHGRLRGRRGPGRRHASIFMTVLRP